MRNVVFAVPFAVSTTLRFARAAASLPGVRLGLLSQDAAEKLRAEVPAMDAHYQIRDALDPAQIAEGVRGLARQWGGHVDCLLGILEQAQEPLAIARQELGLPGMDVATARNFRDKSRMKDVLRQHDLPCARYGLVATIAEATAFSRSIGFPLVVKPPAGAGAKNTARVDTPEQLQACLTALPPSPEHRLLLEEFISGQEYSFDSISIGGRAVFHSISEYYPSPLEVMATPWVQWCVLLPRDIGGPQFEAIRTAGPRALQALGMGTGMTHMEWFRRPNGSIAISEVGARPPGAQFTSLISYAHDLDFYLAWAQLMIHGTFAPPQRRWAVGAAFLRGQGSGRVVGIRGLEQAQRELGGLVVECRLPQRGQAPAGSYEGEGYAILRHPDTEVVKRGLERLVALTRVELG